MRVLKFRAWHKQFKTMVYPDPFDGINISDMGWNIGFMANTKSGELMQFTGLKDKNSKDIYEGDIIVFIGGIGPDWPPEKVYFDGIGWEPFIGDMIDAHKSDRFEIIGNIYENPELLK